MPNSEGITSGAREYARVGADTAGVSHLPAFLKLEAACQTRACDLPLHPGRAVGAPSGRNIPWRGPSCLDCHSAEKQQDRNHVHECLRLTVPRRRNRLRNGRQPDAALFVQWSKEELRRGATRKQNWWPQRASHDGRPPRSHRRSNMQHQPPRDDRLQAERA